MKEPVPNPELYLFTPGPCAVEQVYRNILAEPVMGHRDEPFVQTVINLMDGLTEILGIKDYAKPYVTTATATHQFGNVAQLISHGGNVVLVNSDPFSKKAMEELKAAGVTVHEVRVQLGKTVELSDLERAVKEHQPEVVFITGNNTAPGTYQLRHGSNIREAIGSEPLLVVDEVSVMGGADLDRRALGIDYGFAGVQKNWMLNPGIVIGYATERAIAKAGSRPVPNITNLKKLIESCAEGKVMSTDNTMQIRQLERRIYDMMLAGGRTYIVERNRILHDIYLVFIAELGSYGIRSFPTKEDASPTVGCFTYDLARTDIKAVAKAMRTDPMLALTYGYNGVKIDTGYRDVNDYLKQQNLGSVRIPIFGQNPGLFAKLLNKMKELIMQNTKPAV